MITYNLNNHVIIYPTEHGWNRIIEITKNNYNLSWFVANNWVDERRVDNDGFKEQLWCIMSDYYELFYNGTTCLKNMNIELTDEIQIDIKELRKLKIKNIEK